MTTLPRVRMSKLVYVCICNALTDRRLKEAALASDCRRPGEVAARACGLPGHSADNVCGQF